MIQTKLPFSQLELRMELSGELAPQARTAIDLCKDSARPKSVNSTPLGTELKEGTGSEQKRLMSKPPKNTLIQIVHQSH